MDPTLRFEFVEDSNDLEHVGHKVSRRWTAMEQSRQPVVSLTCLTTCSVNDACSKTVQMSRCDCDISPQRVILF